MPAPPASASATAPTTTPCSTASARATSRTRPPNCTTGCCAMDDALVTHVVGATRPEPLRLCASDELVEKGTAFVFDVLHFREPARAFALRFDGRVVAYLNRCLHVPTEMDWQYGVFLDAGREFIMCATHGAIYEPLSGRCA